MRHTVDAVILRALGLGDLLAAVPALRGIARALPDHRLTVLTSSGLQPLVHAALPRAVVPSTGWDTGSMAGRRPAVAINLHGRGPASTMALMRTEPERLVAFEQASLGVTGPGWCADEHEVDRWCRLVDHQWPGVTRRNDLILPSRRGRSPRRPLVVIHPGAAFASRRWYPRRFGAVAAAFGADGCRVVVTAGVGEDARRDLVVATSGGAAEATMGPSSLEELCTIVAAAQLVVSGDTGVAHVAEAYGRPSVTLFGPTSPALWGPLDRRRHMVLWHGRSTTSGRPGNAAASHIDPRLARVSVAEVLSAGRSLLAEFGAEGPRVPAFHG